MKNIKLAVASNLEEDASRQFILVRHRAEQGKVLDRDGIFKLRHM
jgi:hypothetical protein